MSDQRITPEELSPESIDPELAANEQRAARGERRKDGDDSITGAVENIVSSLTRPLVADEVDEEDAARQRALNDAEQR